MQQEEPLTLSHMGQMWQQGSSEVSCLWQNETVAEECCRDDMPLFIVPMDTDRESGRPSHIAIIRGTGAEAWTRRLQRNPDYSGER